ncbi:MAG: hypothetical protein J3T61_01495 [Candidatus Brocadiales bacterium]|nr:hypothetical protein [Candidatus Bathyanammoxibius sp.]
MTMKRHAIFLCSLALGAVVSMSSPALAAQIWIKNDIPMDPTEGMPVVVAMYADKDFIGRQIIPGNTLMLSDRNITSFVVSAGDYEYHVKVPKDKVIKKTIAFTDIRDNKLPEGYSVRIESGKIEGDQILKSDKEADEYIEKESKTE